MRERSYQQETKKKQIALAEKAVKEGLSVRQIEKLAKDSKTGKAKAKPREKNADVKACGKRSERSSWYESNFEPEG